MKYNLSITQNVMRNINRTAILEHIRKNGSSSRAIIARDLGLSLPSVVRIIDELIEQKLIKYTGESEDSGRRKRPLIELNTKENISVGLDLSGTKAYICLVDLGGNILYEKHIAVHNTKSEEAYEFVVSIINEALSFAKANGITPRGVSVGVPGVTDHISGKVVYAPSLEWRDMPLKKRLEEHFMTSVTVENDVNMAALGELWYGAGEGVSNLAMLVLGTGVGAGLIIDGGIYRGANQAAGELGYIVLEKEELLKTYPTFGPLEHYIAGAGLALQAKRFAAEAARYSDHGEITAKCVFDAYAAGEIWPREIVSNFIDKLSMAIIATCAVLDPEIVILSGGLMNSAQCMIDEIRNKVRSVISVPVELSQLMGRATALGGSVSMIHSTADYCIIRSMF